MTKEQVSNLIGEFTWNFSNKFHIETSEGCFEWSDPDYSDGTNIITPAPEYSIWLGNIPFGRSKGRHRIGDYCGENFTYHEQAK